MTHYIFKTQDGRPRVSLNKNEPDITDVPLTLVGESEEDPRFDGNEFWIDGEWKTLELVSKYKGQRAILYPSIEDQLDDLWHAMDAGAIPKAKVFYDRLKEVKDRYPKTEADRVPDLYER
jgi:hypothetical protein